MVIAWKRRTGVLIGDDLIITRVQLKGDILSILVNSELNEWSDFSLMTYEVSFLKNLRHKQVLGEPALKIEEEPALMILYERNGVIGMSIVLKNLKEFDLLFKSLSETKRIHLNVIEKNTYLEDKFLMLTIDNMIPEDYYEDDPQARRAERKMQIQEREAQPNKFKAYLDMISDIKFKKVLIKSEKGNHIFGLYRQGVGFNVQSTTGTVNRIDVRTEIPTSLFKFINGYFKKLFQEYDFFAIISITVFYTVLVYMSVFTIPQLIIFTIGLMFAVARLDLHLHHVKNERISQNTPITVSSEKELYAKKLVCFSRPELQEYIRDRVAKFSYYQKKSKKEQMSAQQLAKEHQMRASRISEISQ